MRTNFLFVAMLLLVSALAFAGGEGETTGDADGPIVVDAFVRSNDEWADYSPEQNRLVAFFEQEFNVTFDFVVAPEESVDDQKSLLLASGDYPSVFFHGDFTRPERQRYGGLGVLQPLNDLIAQHGPNIEAVLDSDPGYAAGTYAPDGNIYALPGAEVCYHCFYTPKMWINYDWLETLGLDIPQTAEEFEAVLVAFRDGDPNGNGLADEIPFSGSQEGWFTEPRSVLLSPFVYIDTENYLRAENGRVFMTATESAFRDGLIWANGLYEQGLIDPLSFTQSVADFQTISLNPDAALVGAYVGGHQLEGFDMDFPDRWNQYNVLPPLEGTNGHRQATYRGPSYAKAGFAITDKASDEVAQVAIEMTNYVFTTEGGLTAIWGPKGEIWDSPEEGALGQRGEPAVFNWYPDRIEPGVVYGFEPPFYISLETFLGRAQDQNIDIEAGYERRLTLATDAVAPYTPDEIVPTAFWMDDEDADAYAQYLTEFKTYIDRNVVAFITGQQDIATEWDSFQNGLRGLGLDDYLELVQKAYDNQN